MKFKIGKKNENKKKTDAKTITGSNANDYQTIRYDHIWINQNLNKPSYIKIYNKLMKFKL